MGSTERAEEISFLEEKGKGEKKKSWTRSKDKQAAHSEGAEQNTPRCIFFFFFFLIPLKEWGMERRSLAGSRRAALVHGAVLDGEELLGELSTHLTEPTLPRSRALHTPSLSPPGFGQC